MDWSKFEPSEHGKRFSKDSVMFTHPGAKDIFPKQAAYLALMRERLVDLAKIHQEYLVMRPEGTTMIILPFEDTLQEGERLVAGDFQGDFAKKKPDERRRILDTSLADVEQLEGDLVLLMRNQPRPRE